MSENEEEPPKEEYRFFADRSKTGRSGCKNKKCKQKIETNTLRMAKAGPNPFGSGMMKMWHHVNCMFEVFSRQRATTAKIESLDDIGGWDALSKEDQEEIMSKLPESARVRLKPPPEVSDVTPKTPKKKASSKKTKESTPSKRFPGSGKDVLSSQSPSQPSSQNEKDNSLREFRRLCAEISNVSSYLEKTNIVQNFITNGTDGVSFKGDLALLIKLLLPGVMKRIYNIQSKQIVKLFSRLFGTDHDEMLENLEQGDVAETIRIFFESSTKLIPNKKSTLSIQDVDQFLDNLSLLTREEDQMNHFGKIAPLCTPNDLKIIIRLIKHDLRINAGAKHILDAVNPDAYEAFQASRDLKSILARAQGKDGNDGKSSTTGMDVGIILLTPVLPMLAQPCKTVNDAMKRCPNGMYSEVKYDGERVQVHKKGHEFKFYSRSLKPVLPHKVKSLQEYIPKAFPYGKDLILDSEILLIDTRNGKPLPFGSLGAHKKSEFKDANVCLFVFDCIYFNGESWLSKPLKERKRILKENMNEIPNRVVFSEMEEIHEPKALADMITKVIRLGLEGLVLKDIMSIYEPGKRHWLKVKKDYLYGGAMADAADLVVLGAWYGTGQKGGMMSVFLMGCYDEARNVWCTVTKVHTGHDDKTLEKLQTELDMVKISKDPSKVPPWLKCTKTMVPDFVAKDPKEQPVWEIAGAELTKHVVHTADGISVRFPRVVKIREDKDWKSATSLNELRQIFDKSKETTNFTLAGIDYDIESPTSSPKKTKPNGCSPKKAKPNKKLSESESIQKKRKVDVSSWIDTSKTKKPKYVIKKPLPDVFIGVKLVLDEGIANKETLERYFIAFGGEVLEPCDSLDSTHVIKDTGAKVPDGCKEIDVQWLWDCIEKKKLLQ